jgi:hypothetical protein
MCGAVRRAHGPEGALEKFKELLSPMPQLQTGQLELTGEVAHIFAGRREQIYTALSEFFGLGVREVAAIADPDPVLHPAGEGSEQFTIINRSGGEIKAAQAARLITLHVQLEAVPPAHTVFRFTRPGARRAVLAGARHVTHSHRSRLLQDDGISPVGVPIAMERQG